MSWGWEIDPPDKAYDAWCSWHEEPEDEREPEGEGHDEYEEDGSREAA